MFYLASGVEVQRGYTGWLEGLAVSGSSFPCTVRASADGLSARRVGFLTWQPGAPTVSVLGEAARLAD